MPAARLLRPDVMRIGLITRSCPIAATDGIARQRQMLARALADRGHDVHVFTIADRAARTPLGGATVHAGVRPRHVNPWFSDLPVLDWPLTDGQLLAELVWQAHEAAPFDVIDVPLWMAHGNILLEQPPCPIVLWLQTSLGHLVELQARPPRAHERVLLALEARALAQAALVLGDSHAILDDLQRLHRTQVPPARAAVVWPGIDDSGSEWPLARPIRDRIDVLVVGRLEHRKGTPDLLARLPAWLRAHPRMHLTFIGADNSDGDGFKRETGRSYPEWFRAEHPDLEARVTFLGRVSEDDLCAAYREADLLLHAARYESFGLVFVEAMRAGLPAVAFDVAGAREIHDVTTARLVPADDWTALLAQTAALAADPEARACMGGAARARYTSRFSAEAMADRTLEAYRRAISSGTRQRDALRTASAPTPGAASASNARATESDRARLFQVTEALVAPDGIGHIIRTQARLLAPLGGVRPIQTIYVQPQVAAETGRIMSTRFTSADVAMLHFYGYSRLARVFERFPGRRVLHYHNITPPRYFAPHSEPFEMTTRGLAQMPWFARQADVITGDSTFNVRECAAALDAPRPTLTLYPVVDRESLAARSVDAEYLESLRDRKRRQPDEAWLLFVGRVARNKRQDAVVAAAGRLASGWHRRVRIVLCGSVADPAFRADIDALGRQHPHLGLEWPGLVSDEQLAAWYRVADAFVSASEHEGFGIPLAEAMAFGLPVIAAAHAAVPETLGESGVLLSSWDEIGAAEAVARLLDRPAERDAIVRGQYRNLERFSEAALDARLRELTDYLWTGRVGASFVESGTLLASAGIRTGVPA
jgi:glycosyltransferase involved in cell wall biosynthesis